MRRVDWFVVVAIGVMGCTAPIAPADTGPMRVDTGPRPDGGVDAALEADAGIDAFVPVDAATPEDAGTDAAAPDTGVDAAVVCIAPEVNCGGSCVNLSTSAANCGACGYAVVPPRTCVAGRPDPSWSPMSTSGGPATGLILGGWTGRSYLYVAADGSVRSYDPTTNTWSSRPALPFTLDLAHAPMGMSMPNRNAYFVWTGTTSYVYHDDATPTWSAGAGPSLGAPTERLFGSLAYDGTRVFVAFGAQAAIGGGGYSGVRTDVGIFDASTGSWLPTSAAASSMSQCSGGHNRVEAPAVVANDALVLFGGNQDNSGACITDTAAMYDVVGGTWLTSRAFFPGITQTYGHVMLSLGSQALTFGDQATDRVGARLLDPRGAVSITTMPPGANLQRLDPYVAYDGRSIFYWGGHHVSGTSDDISDGSLGVVTGTTITWATLPPAGISARSPAAYRAHGGDGLGGNTQDIWTGHEFVVQYGYQYTPTVIQVFDGSRYQPPVGCVCPRNADAPAAIQDSCSGVSMIADTSCVP
jgi:hypothetical protein